MFVIFNLVLVSYFKIITSWKHQINKKELIFKKKSKTSIITIIKPKDFFFNQQTSGISLITLKANYILI